MTKTIINTVLVVLYSSGVLFGQTVHRAFVNSQGGDISQLGIIRHEVIVGQTAANTGSISLTGISGNIGFLTIDKPVNTAPVANAGKDNLYTEGVNIQLDGTTSSDPQGDGLTYIWESLDGITLLPNNSPMPSFVAPDVLARRKLHFVLKVSDGEFTSSGDTVIIVVSDPDWIPVTYSNSTVTYATVTLNNIVAEACDFVGAYVNGQCRAVVEVVLFQGKAYAVFNIQGELPETVNFRVYDYSEDRICDAPSTVTSTPGGDLGTFNNPIPINAQCSVYFAAFGVSNQNICADQTITINFTGGAGQAAQYNWDFEGATIVSGTGQGPYTIRWVDAGSKTLRLQISENGVLSNEVTKSVLVFPNSSSIVTQYTCNQQDTATQVLKLSNIYGCDSTVFYKTLYEPTIFNLIGADDYCNDPFVKADVISGPGNYTFQWSTGDNTQTVFGVPDGSYGVTISDAAGCTYSGLVQVGGTLPLSATTSMQQGAGCAIPNGIAIAQVSGGIPPYSYQWDNGETSATATGLPAGNHVVTIEDAAGCLTEAMVLIIPLNFPFVSGATTQDYFCGVQGSINVSIVNGTQPFTYLWSNGQKTKDISGLLPGLYSLTATDQNGCIATINNLEIKNKGDNISLVFSQQNCAISISALNGAGPYNFTWNNSLVGPSISPVIQGETYIVTAIDANGCFGTDTIVAQTGVTTAGFNFALAGFDASFSGDSTVTTSFWDFGDGFTSSDTNPVHTYASNGTYTVQHITISACGNDTASVVLTINFVKTTEPNEPFKVWVLPNPSTGIFNVKAAFDKPIQGQYSVYNVLGSLLTEGRIQGIDADFDLDLTSQYDGVYWLSIRTEATVTTYKLIKQGN